MSRPLSLSGRKTSQRTNAVEYPITRKISTVAANESGHNNINNSNDHNYGYDYDDTHPLPAPPAPAHSRFDPLQGYEQEQEQEQGQDEPQSLQFVNSSGRINNSKRNNSATAKRQQEQQSDNLSDIPPPLPSKKTFYSMHPEEKDHTYSYNYRPPTSPPTFLDAFMSRHPKISRHRRRFAALIFTIVTLLLLTIVLLAVLLTHKGDDGGFNGNGSIGGGGGDNNGGLGQPGNEWGDGATATAEALRKHNAGISPAPINHNNAPGWTSLGKGEGTFYDPSIMNGAGQFQMGACEFPYINSAMDMIAALNKPDFGNFARASTSPACGQCLQVTGPNGTVTVQVVDMCPGCKSGDVDLTPGAFAKIARLDDGRVRISWRRC